MKYYRPATVKDALKILGNRSESCIPLYFPPRAKHISEWRADAMVELTDLGLDEIQIKENEVIFGSMVSFETIAKSEAVKALWDGVLSEAAYLSATGALRNLASLGGSLMNPNFPAELILVLLALDAKIVLVSGNGSEQKVNIEDFLKDGKPELKKGSLIKAVILPLEKKTHLVLDRVARTPSDASIVSVVVKADFPKEKADQIRIAVFGASPAPKRFQAAEKALGKGILTDSELDKAAEKAVKEAKPVGDYRGSQEYRAAMAGTLTRRALKKLAEKSGN